MFPRLVYSPWPITGALVALTAMFTTLSLVAAATGVGDLIFALDGEANLPTWFAGNLLLAASLLLAVIAGLRRTRHQRYAGHWAGLSLVFLYLSADEVGQLHDRLNYYMTAAFNPQGALHFPWVVPASAALVVLSAVYFRFLRDLPRRTQVAFVAAAVVYVGGALGMELVGATVASANGQVNLAYVLVTHLEETLEMLGVVVFLHGLLNHLRLEAPAFLVSGSAAVVAPLSTPQDAPASRRTA